MHTKSSALNTHHLIICIANIPHFADPDPDRMEIMDAELVVWFNIFILLGI